MLKKITLFGLMVLFLLSLSGAAVSATKIAYVEVGKVLQESPQVKAVKEKIRKEFSKRDDQLVSEQKKLKKLKEKLKRDGSIMSDAEVKRLERD
ncbi:OmpH family outer membrane protein, partial [Thiolapillus sp.]